MKINQFKYMSKKIISIICCCVVMVAGISSIGIIRVLGDTEGKAASEEQAETTVRLEANGGKINGEESITIKGKIGSPLIVSAPERDGYVFIGWYSDTQCSVLCESVFPEEDNTVLYAGWSNEGIEVLDFEPTLDGTNTVTSGTLSIDGQEVHVSSYDTSKEENQNIWSVVEEENGNNVLSIDYTEPNKIDRGQYQVGVMLFNDGTSLFSLTPGSRYTVTFRYKVIDVGKTNDAWLYLTQSPEEKSNGIWGNLTAKYNALDGSAHSDAKNRILPAFSNEEISNGYKDLNGSAVILGEWNTFSYTFTATDKGDNNYLGFAACAIPDLTIHIDDIVIAREPLKVIAFETNGGTAVKPVIGSGDNTIEMPDDPIKGSYGFLGWYTDKELTKEFTADKFSDLDTDLTVLYAKWGIDYINDEDFFDFENDSTLTSGSIYGTPISSYDDSSGKNNYAITKDADGNSVLEIRYPSGAGAHYKNGSLILNKDGRIPQLEEGKKYTVTMRVKINSLNTQANARVVLTEDMIVGNTGMPDEFGVVLGDSSAFTDAYTAGSRLTKEYMLIRDIVNGATPVKDINNDTVPIGQWHNITRTFTAYPSKTNGNLYVGITACTGTGFSMYIDDIRFIDASKKVISFQTNGGDYINSIYGEEGKEVNLPELIRDNYEFEGWYTDPEFENKASDPFVIGKENITLYAKWKNTQGILVDFENTYNQSQTDVNGWSNFGGAFFLNRDGQKSHGQLAEFNQDGCFDGTSSLLVKYSGTSDYSSVLLRNSDNISGITARPGEKFRITLKYKAAFGNISGAKFAVAVSENSSSGWYKVNRSKYVAYVSQSANNGWQTMTFIYKNDTDKNQFMHLLLDVTSAIDPNAAVYVDNISVKLLDENIVAVAVDYLDGANTAYYFGEAGDPLAIKAASPREGYSFLYFAVDEKGNKKFTSSVFPQTDTDVYAIWEMVKIIVDFENYPSAWTQQANPGSLNLRFTRFADISSEKIYSGSKSLHIGVSENLKQTDYTYVALDYNSSNVTLSNKTKYFVNFYYYADHLESDLNVYLATANANNVWVDLKQYSTNTFAIKSVDMDAGWKKGSILFETDFKSDSANALYLMTSGYSNPTSIYFDYITVEKIPSTMSAITFVRGDGAANEYSIKYPGAKITFPELGKRKYYDFAGWYRDASFKSKFDGTVHPNGDLVLYAKWNFKSGIKINVDFENYSFNLPDNTEITTVDKSGGNKSLYFDCGEEGSVFAVALNLDDTYLTVSNGQRFAISFDYKLNAAPYDSSKQLSLSFFTASSGFGSAVQQKFAYNYEYNGGMRWWIRTTAETGVWQQFSDTVTIENAENGNILYFVFHQGDRITGFIDNITVTPLAEDDVAITTDKFTTKGKPYYIGKKGQTFTLEQNLERPGNYAFLGWYADNKYTNEIFSGKFDTDTKVFASWAIQSVSQDFENFAGVPGIKMIGSDYEIYGPDTEGFDKLNVYSGSFSLHRKGASHLWQNAQIIDTKLAIGSKYTVEFWVKMDSSLHTDGAVRIASGGSFDYPYDYVGEYFNVITIDELSDHKWHKVSYTFDSLSNYLIISTPGYCSIYFDDVKLTYSGKDAKVSTPVSVKNEYVPLRRNSDGTLAEEELVIKDTSLVSHRPDTANTDSEHSGGNINVLAVVLGCFGGAAVIAVGILLIVLKLKGKLRKKA